MSTFRVPLGDPVALRSVVDAVSRLSQAVGETRSSRLGTIAGTAEAALPTARVADFAGARRDAADATAGVGLSLVSIGGALGGYAEALETAQGAVRSAYDGYERAMDDWRHARSMGEEQLAATCRRTMTRFVDAADAAQDELSASRTSAEQALGQELEIWVPGGGSLSPVKAWEQAATGMMPAGIALDPDQLRDAYTNLDPSAILAATSLSNLVKAGLKGFQAYQVLSYLRAPTLARNAEDAFFKAQQAYQAIKGAAPDLRNAATYKDYITAERAVLTAYTSRNPAGVMQAQRLYRMLRGVQGEATALAKVSERFPTLGTVEILGKAGRFEKLLAPVRAITPIASKVLGPLAIGLGAYDMYTSVTEEGLAQDDRAARFVGGAATVVGGAATTLLAFGVIANPVGLMVVAVAGVVAVGCWAYENRDAIAEGATKVGSAVADGAEKLGEAVADGATKVWKGLFG